MLATRPPFTVSAFVLRGRQLLVEGGDIIARQVHNLCESEWKVLE